LPPTYAEKNFYYYIMGGVRPEGFKVMGDVWHAGDVLLAISDMRKWESPDGGKRSELWGWFQGLFSECRNVN
jgi:hypothetical protein